MWINLNRVFERFKQSDPRVKSHSHICAIFPLDQQFSNVDSVRRELGQLLGGEPLISGSGPIPTDPETPPTPISPVPTDPPIPPRTEVPSSVIPLVCPPRTASETPTRGAAGATPRRRDESRRETTRVVTPPEDPVAAASRQSTEAAQPSKYKWQWQFWRGGLW
jgi:hypothetical protein